MKALIIIIASISTAVAAVDQKTPVSVSAFKPKAATSYNEGTGCYGWSWFADLGNAFSDVLVEKLNEQSKYEVLERAQIHNIYENEVDLINSEKDKSIEKGKFRKAKITFVGVVDGFEFCQSSTKASVDVGSILGIGNIVPKVKLNKASISLMIRAIDTTTGKVIATARSKKTQNSQTLGLDVSVAGVSASGSDFRQSMLGEAIKEAVDDAADELIKKL